MYVCIYSITRYLHLAYEVNNFNNFFIFSFAMIFDILNPM